MTKSANKPVKVSRDSLDLDLDARLDEATSTLTLDDEPPEGDALDQVLARAKKELDTNLPKELPQVPEELEGIHSIKSDSMTSLENQLAAAMETSIVSDDELDNLLGSAGFDFDSLLGESSNELKPNEIEMNEDSLMAAVDELLNIGAFDNAESEPEMIEETPIKPKPKRKTKLEPEPEIIAEALPEIVTEELPEIEQEPEIVEFDENEFETVSELTVEPEAALNDLVDSVPFEESLTVDSEELNSEDFNSFNSVDDEPLVEISTSAESLDDDLNAMQQFDELNETMENKNDAVTGFDLLDDDTTEKEVATSVTETVDDDDWMKQLDDLENFETPETEAVLPVNLEKVADELPEIVDDEDDWMKQLDELENFETPETEAALPVNLEKTADELPEIVDEDDWMKQLDELENAESEAALPVDLEKTADELPEIVDDDDWMKQLDELENAESEAAEAALPVNLEKTADELPEIVDEDDWMKQLDELENAESESAEAALPVDLEKTADELPEIVDDGDDWMKQLDELDDHDEDTAKMLMDAGSENLANTFNIADEAEADTAKLIDEDAPIVKAAEPTVSQEKENNDLAMSQLRADQDSVDSKNKQQFAEVEKKRKKTAMFGYIALGVGVIGLLGSAGIGWLSYDTKNNTETLNESVTALEGKLNTFLSKNPEKEIENLKVSVEQLNQKVEKIAAAQIIVPPVAAIKPNSPVDLLNGKAAVPASNGKIESPITTSLSVAAPSIDNSASVIETTPLKSVESVKLADMTKKSAKKAEAVKAAEIDKATEKAEAELLIQKIEKANAVAKAAANANDKNDAQRKVDRYSGRMTRGMAHAGRKDKTENAVATKTNVIAPVKEVLNAEIKPQKAIPAGKYSVNVISYQQEWFAQSKAAEFKQKGIPVEVVPVDANNSGTKFRLKVGGFKSKAEASAYANKIKNANGGNEPWVGVNE